MLYLIFKYILFINKLIIFLNINFYHLKNKKIKLIYL